MKIGIIADIHNNVVALDAVLSEFERQRCTLVVCAGDIIGIGPYPEETVQKMRSISNLIAVRGNHEKYLLEGMPAAYPNAEGMSEEEMAYHRWEHQRLSPASVAFLRELPYRADFHVLGKKISVMHYGMNQENQYAPCPPTPSAAQVWALFPEQGQDIVIYGHDHRRMICQHQSRWLINSGSLGCPAADKNLARAAILEITDHAPISVGSLVIPYDENKVLEEIDRLNYPTAGEIKRIFYGVHP